MKRLTKRLASDCQLASDFKDESVQHSISLVELTYAKPLRLPSEVFEGRFKAFYACLVFYRPWVEVFNRELAPTGTRDSITTYKYFHRNTLGTSAVR